MQHKINQVSLAGLLHDIGKVVQRAGGESGTHSQIGARWLEENVGFTKDTEVGRQILDSVRYHHRDALRTASLPTDSLAYLVYEADNIASGTDRRPNDIESDGVGFDSSMPLESIFDYLKGTPKEEERIYHYLRGLTENNQHISFGKRKSEGSVKASPDKYKNIVELMLQHMKTPEASAVEVTSTINTVEALWSYIPSSTNKQEIADISLYDHVKITAALANAMYLYADEQHCSDYKELFYQNGKANRDKSMFRIVSGDLSGIQQFIYTASGSGALKSLRGRSFYLDMLLEHIVDELLALLGLNRCNLLYTGGGHFYLLIANVNNIEDILTKAQKKLNDWFLTNTNAGLYIALSSISCTANQLMAQSADGITIGDLFRQLALKLNNDKRSRYDQEQLAQLFDPTSPFNHVGDGARECAMCKTSKDGALQSLSHYRVIDQGDTDIEVCHMCGSLYKFGNDIVNEKKNVYVISYTSDNLRLPNLSNDREISLAAYSEAGAQSLPEESIHRMYTKNALYVGEYLATHIWVGDYMAKFDNGMSYSFEDFANDNPGVKRLGILRADVDNLGSTFVTAFRNSDQTKLTLSRMATLSRQLSLFFKYYINYIAQAYLTDESEISQEGYHLWKRTNKERHIGIVYSGGDDLFLVGAWDEILGFAVDLYKAFKRLTGGRLTFSAGLAMTGAKLPVRTLANLAGDFESASKSNGEKNSITLFREFMDDAEKNIRAPFMHTFTWDTFISGVIEDKVEFLKAYIKGANQGIFTIGKGQLYKLVDLLRIALGIRQTHRGDAYKGQFLYWLARLEPQGHAKQEIKESYQAFREKLYDWFMVDETDQHKKELLCAIIILVYESRDK